MSTLVIAAAVALVMIRNAQQEAKSQAERVQDQLVLTQEAEVGARSERAKAVAASEKLESQNASLLAAIEAAKRAQGESERQRIEAERERVEAEAARKRAEISRRLEQRSRQLALEAAKRANEAAAAAKRAELKLKALLVEEQKRVQELEALTRGAKIIRT